MVYETKHKKTVEDIMRVHCGKCFTADNICSLLKEAGCSVSAATVYRRLDALVKEGVVSKIPAHNGGYLYQYIKCEAEDGEHCSLMCNACGKLIHLDCDELSKLSMHIKAEHNFTIDHFKMVIYGLCDECEKTNK